MRFYLVILFLMVGSVSAVLAEDKDVQTNAEVHAAYKRNLKKYADCASVKVFPGMVADREAGRLTLDAVATGLKPGEIAEFVLVGPGSEHGYEAIAVSHADARSVHEGLVFLGIKPGKPVDPASLRFWPKGERVNVTFEVEKDGRTISSTAEGLIDDKRTGKSLRTAGFVFVGSSMIEDPSDSQKVVYAADHRGPHSIISNYNEPDTVLDVPRQAAQGEVYDHQVVSAGLDLEKGSPIKIVISPERRKGESARVMDFDLKVRPGVGSSGTGLAGLVFDIGSADGPQKKDASLNEVLELLTSVVEKQHDPFVSLELGEGITIADANAVCRILASIETETGIRVEPPSAGQLYYRAFMPREDFRSRSSRFAQPCELHLRQGEDGNIDAELVEITQSWSDGKLKPDLSTKTIAVSSPEVLEKELASRDTMRVILVFAGEGITLGKMRSFIRPVQDTHPTIHVYAGQPED